MRRVDFAELRQRVSIARVLDLLGWMPSMRERSGRRGPCPVHGSRFANSRSFWVGDVGFKCHSCGAEGNALDLFAQVRRLGLRAAAIKLCEELGETVPWLPRGPRL